MKRSCHDYHTLRQRLTFLVSDASVPQANNLALFVFGLLAAWHVHLPKIALSLPVGGLLKNSVQRLERFLKNPAVQANDWYAGIARALLARFAGTEIDLILDATDLGDRHPMLFVALRHRGRAFPIRWRMLPSEGCSASTEQEALLRAVVDLVPSGVLVTLLADREYGSCELIRFCLRHGWHFVFRLKKNRWCRLRTGHAFQLFELPLRPGTDWCEDGITLEDVPGQRFSLSCGWSEQHPDDEPWYLLSGLPAGRHILARYGGRFSIEEMFRDFKEQGFRLEKTRLQDTERVCRLVLCVCIAYVFALLLGETVEARGIRRWVEHSTKRQISLFQMGLRYLKRLLVLGQDWTELLILRI
ncbi:MAG TPA: IS4 family transposase [Chthonomonadaceae bacterium]|nr:IS4 family transposase [Chthonomonadaceae bacterium]